MRALWDASLGLSRPQQETPTKRAASWARPLRNGLRYQRALQMLKWNILPNTFGALLLAAAALVLVVLTVGTLRRRSGSPSRLVRGAMNRRVTSSRPLRPVGR
jgi:hypothetical protein